MRIFSHSRYLWGKIEEDVKAWTLLNWSRWEEEKPEWFNPTLHATIPDDFIPTESIAALGGTTRLRRGSASMNAINVGTLGRRLSFQGERRLSFGGEVEDGKEGN